MKIEMIDQIFLKQMQKAGCAYRWNYPIIRYDKGEIGTCCQVVPLRPVSENALKDSGFEDLFNTDYLVSRREEMLKGIQHDDCSACWKLESAGMHSMRQRSQDMVQYLAPELLDIQNPNPEDFKKLARVVRPHILEIHLDDICDMSCVYCGPALSTTWARKKGISFQKKENAFVEAFHQKFWQWYETIINDLESVCIIGGEPLMSPQFIPVLDQLLKIHSEKKREKKRYPFMSITSNFNARSEVFQRFLGKLDALSQHFEVVVSASCEALGKNAEFIREGLKWERFENNVKHTLDFLRKSKNERIHFSFNAAQNVFSIISIPSFLNWCVELEEQYQVPVNLLRNVVSYPAHFSAQSILSADFARYCQKGIDIIKQRTERPDFRYVSNSTWALYKEFLESLKIGLETGKPDEKIQEVFKDWLKSQSNQRILDFNGNFPELQKFLSL